MGNVSGFLLATYINGRCATWVGVVGVTRTFEGVLLWGLDVFATMFFTCVRFAIYGVGTELWFRGINAGRNGDTTASTLVWVFGTIGCGKQVGAFYGLN